MANKRGGTKSKKTTTTRPKKKNSAKKTSTLKTTVEPAVSVPRKLPNAWQIARRAAQTIWQHKKLLFGVVVIYGLLNLIFVQGLASTNDVRSLKAQLNSSLHGEYSSLGSSIGVFAVLVGSAGNGSSDTAGAYQTFLGIIGSLALIWTLRQLAAGQVPRVRDAWYKGMYPLVPFILLIFLIMAQLLPLLIGAVLFSFATSAALTTSLAGMILWILIYAAFAWLTLYWLSASLISLYIVTLPNMQPWHAYKSARQLVKGRRFYVIRKVLALPIILLLIAAVIMVPIILWATGLAQWIFFALTMLGLLAIHAYMYTMYRELLNE